MSDKLFWRGIDLEEMSREQLIEIIRELGKSLEATRKWGLTSINLMRDYAKAARLPPEEEYQWPENGEGW